MSSENELVLPAPREVDIDEFSLLGDNRFRLWIRFDDGAYLALDFNPGTEPHETILDTLAEVVTERLHRLGKHGVVITGMTQVEDEEGSSG